MPRALVVVALSILCGLAGLPAEAAGGRPQGAGGGRPLGAAPTVTPRSAAPAVTEQEQGPQQQAGRDNGQWPPAGVQRPGPGVTLPRVLREAKPTYTSEAMRAGIEGTVTLECVVQPDGTIANVRVIKSLDSVYGLDQEAVKAAKQWRFVPGTKDGVAVPVLVSIELSFTLRGPGPRGAVAGWPAVFPSASDVRAGAELWSYEAVEVRGIRVGFYYPPGWALRKDVTAGGWFAVQDGLRLLVVSHPQPGPAPQLPERPATAERLRVSETGRPPTSGRAQMPDRVWTWSEAWMPADDPAFPSDAISWVERAFDGAVKWSFTTTAGPDTLQVQCYVLRPRGLNASTPEAQEEERQAGAQFRLMLERMKIEVR